MTRKALRSAVLEVGLFYEKRWSEERIARFTDRLNRRRVRELKAAARSQLVARTPAESPMVAFEVEQAHPAGIAYAIAPSTANTRTPKERLVDGIRAQLSKSSDAEQAAEIDAKDRSEARTRTRQRSK